MFIGKVKHYFNYIEIVFWHNFFRRKIHIDLSLDLVRALLPPKYP